MIQIEDKKQCCGCTACYNICPRRAIQMEPDEEGFLYPQVNKEICVDCGLCERVCPVIHRVRHEEKTESYIIRNNDAVILEESTSGGAFTAFAMHLMEKGAVVYGAGYDEDMQVICKMASEPAQLKEMRGSKFVQSNLGDVFAEIKKQLSVGMTVLFTGTPCQVAGLVNYLNEKPHNLICIDFVCRGVPSPGLWKNYVNMMEKKYKAKMIGARFKHKTYGYHTTTMKVDFANGRTWYGSGRVDPMMKAFVNEMASRPSCSKCAFKGVERLSDITMFDCYGFSKITGEHDDDKGYTSLFVHTSKGQELLAEIQNQIVIYKAEIENLVDKNGVMVRNSAKENPKREAFYQFARDFPIDIAMNKVSPITKWDYWIEIMKAFMYMTGLIKIARKLKKKRKIEIVNT